MSTKKRIIIIILLIIFAFFLAFITKIFENRLHHIETINSYEPFKKIKYYKKENGERYIRYYEKNNNLNYEDIVTEVNIGLDYGFYNYIKKTDIKKDTLMLINKFQKLDENYIPNDLEEINNKYFIYGNKDKRLLRKEAKYYFEKLSEDSIKNNTPVYGQSAYRSYQNQEYLYNYAKKNSNNPDLDTARAGHSEHQTGLTIDVSSNKKGNMLQFEKTNSFQWMKDNAYKYGFILRYPKGKENIHGFIYEPWHYRYVGLKVAKDMHNNYSNLTYDEYYYKFIEK